MALYVSITSRASFKQPICLRLSSKVNKCRSCSANQRILDEHLRRCVAGCYASPSFTTWAAERGLILRRKVDVLDELDLAVFIFNDVIAMQAVTVLVEGVGAFDPFIA